MIEIIERNMIQQQYDLDVQHRDCANRYPNVTLWHVALCAQFVPRSGVQANNQMYPRAHLQAVDQRTATSDYADLEAVYTIHSKRDCMLQKLMMMLWNM